MGRRWNHRATEAVLGSRSCCVGSIIGRNNCQGNTFRVSFRDAMEGLRALMQYHLIDHVSADVILNPKCSLSAHFGTEGVF
jgi:hypothetical protein